MFNIDHGDLIVHSGRYPFAIKLNQNIDNCADRVTDTYISRLTADTHELHVGRWTELCAADMPAPFYNASPAPGIPALQSTSRPCQRIPVLTWPYMTECGQEAEIYWLPINEFTATRFRYTVDRNKLVYRISGGLWGHRILSVLCRILSSEFPL